jgi:hypothetical protein
MVGIFLNPSKADALIDDMTMTIFAERARSLGCGGIDVGNIFAFRATYPKDMMAADDPVGPGNDEALIHLATGGGGPKPHMVIGAWGDGGLHLNRAAHVSKLLDAAGVAIHRLGVTKAGQPRQPLRIPYRLMPVVWKAAA